MSFGRFDRFKLRLHDLRERENKVFIERDALHRGQSRQFGDALDAGLMDELVGRIRKARENGRPVIMAFGAHSIKNGLGPVLGELIEHGWITHLATNGAGIIHDWEFSYLGESSEDVRANVREGKFGIWRETGFFLNLALCVGAYEGLGYGESVGSMIENEGLMIPDRDKLHDLIRERLTVDPDWCAGACDLLKKMDEFELRPGWMAIPHKYKQYSAQACAYRTKVPFTAHPMFGHDIIYTHPMNCGPAIGRSAERDFLTYAAQVHRLEGGVYLSVGSAVMSPMIFEKSLSMSQNIELQHGRRIENHYMVVVDLAKSEWDWSRDGEPPMDNPAYYLRYCKTFNRMGGTMRYLCADNRRFLLTLAETLI